jgi:hypothetical protein
MIRDPSDGTVKEINPEANKINTVTPKTLLEEISGLPAGSQRQANIARLEFSREWLKQYHAKKESADARGNDGKELQAAGHSIEGERAAKPASSA